MGIIIDIPSLVLCETRFDARTSLLSAERFGPWTDYVNNGYIIGNVETSTPSHMVIRPSMVMFILLVELVNSDH